MTSRILPRRSSGFTLIELLTVIAIIGILAAIIIPTTGKVREAARRSQVKSQFSQWGAAIDQFRTEYGYYPNFSTTTTGTIPDAAKVNEVAGLFFHTLTGRDGDGVTTNLLDRAKLANSKRIAFTSFSPDEATSVTNPVIKDAFENTDISVIVDRDLNGVIPATVIRAVSVTNASSGDSFQPTATTVPNDVRAGVVFFTAGPSGLVYSWQ